MAENAEQLDLYEPADQESRARVVLIRAADRYGVPELAAALRLDERTLRNQLDHRKRLDKSHSFWRPNEDCVWKLFFSDRRLREELLAICDERIEDIEVITHEDFAREVVAAARTKKYGEQAADEITRLYRRVKKGGSR